MAFEVPTPEGSGLPKETTVQKLNVNPAAQTPSQPAPSTDPLDNVDVPQQQHKESTDPLDNVDAPQKQSDPLDSAPTTGAKITSLSQSYQLKRQYIGGAYQPIPGDDISPDISNWNFPLNPDYQRTFNVDFEQSKKLLAAHKVAILSNLDEGGQNMLRSAIVADQSIPMPSQQLNVLTPRTPSKEIMENLRKSDESFWGGVQNEVSGKIDPSENAPIAMPKGFDVMNPKSMKLLIPGQKYNIPGTTGKGNVPGVKIWDGESFRPIPEGQQQVVSPRIIKGVLQELSGMDTIPAEQISSRLQDIRNDKKYEALVDAGYAPSIDPKLPKDIQTFLKSDEYLNRSFEDKKLYAKQLYMAHSQELAGMAPNDFYEDIKSTFTPELNATFLRQGASDNIGAAQKVLSGLPKKQDPHSGLVYDDVDNPNYALASKAISNYSKIIDDNPADGLSQKYIKALAQNVGGIDPVINPLIDAGDAIDLHRVISKVKTSGEESLTPGEKVLFDSQAMINSYQNIARPDVMTQAIGGIPSAIGFMISLGVTKGITKASTKLLGGYLSAATPAMVSNLGETLRAIKDVAPSLQKVADYSVGVGSKLSSGAAEVTVQTMIARNAAVLTSTLHDMAGDPMSSFTYDTANKTTEISTPNKDGVKTTLLKRALMEAVNLGAFKVAGKLTQFQDAALLRLVDKYPAADKWLNYLYTQNAFESMQRMGMKIENPLAIGSIIRKLDVPSVPAEFVALQFIPARVNALIKGDNSDELMSNFPVQIKKDLVGFAGLALVSGLGRLTSIAQGIYLAKVTYANEFRMMDFMNKVYSPTDIEFHHPDYQADLNKIWQNLYRSRDKKNVTAAELMRAHVEIRKAFDNDEIEGVNKDTIPTAKDYMEQCAAAQTTMNGITDDIKAGTVDIAKIQGAIDNAPDTGFKQQFQFYLDMVNSYSKVSTGETLKQFIDKYKKEYQSIKDDLLVTDMMKTAPNWEVYRERIAVLPLPQTYKDECLSILNNVYTRWKDERDSHVITTDRKDTPMYFRVDGKSSHSLSMNPYGKYSLVSTGIEDFIADSTTAISKMNNENLSELFNIVQNSDLNPEQKSKLNESIKERLLLSFKDTEFLTDIGGAKNFVELISMANDLQLASPFTADEKQQLTLSIGHILSNEIKKEFSPENISQIKSVLQTCMQYLNVFKPADIMDLTKFIYKQATKVTIENASNQEITQMASEGDKDAVEELDFRTRNGFLNDEEKKLALEMLKGKDIKVGKDFEVLAKSNKYVKRLDAKLQELVTQGRITENDRFVLQGIISLQSMEHFKFNRIELQKTTDDTAASYYNPASKGLVIQYTDNTPAWQIVGEMSHEIIHMAHHNIALSLGRGGIGVGDFVMDERTINEITKSTRADVVANMARWYQGKEYSYDNYLRLYKLGSKRNSSERAEYDAIVNMLDWYRNHFNQADRNNMEFIDDINKDLKWNFTTESLVKNFNRWTEMRKAGYSPARAHYFSAYAHESIAELMSTRNIKLVANRIGGDAKIASLVDNVSDWTSKNIKIPILQRLYRSTIFDGSDAKKYLNTLISQRDVDNMMKISTTPDECANDTIKDELDNISGNVVGTKREGIPPLSELREEYRKIIEQGNPQLIEDLYDHILTTIKYLGYDSSMLSDLIGQINKDANLINAETIEPKVLRHGDTEEVMNQISDSPEEPLDELGIAQAKQYGEQFLMDGITTIYCSNMKRNMETAVVASKVCGADVKSNPLFRTMDTGDFTGFPETEFDEKHYVDNPDEKIPGGESFNEFLSRCTEAKKIKDSLDGKSAIISNSKMMAVWQALDDNAQVWNDDAKKDYLEREESKDIFNPQVSIREKFDMVDEMNKKGKNGKLIPNIKDKSITISTSSEVKQKKVEGAEPNKCETNVFNFIKNQEGNRYFPVGGYLINNNNTPIEHWWVYDSKTKKQFDITPNEEGMPKDYIKGYVGTIEKNINGEIKKADKFYDIDFFKGGNVQSLYFDKILEAGEKEGAPLYTGAFKNLHDLIDNNSEADKLNRIGSYAGLKGLDNIRTSDPKLYKELRANLDMWKRVGATNSMENFLKYGFFMETLGKKFEKFEISDKNMRMDKKILDEASEVTKNGTTLNMNVGDFITHKNLFNAYPELASLRLTFYNNPKSNEFGFAQNKGIGLNLAHINHPEFHIGAIVIHELQHKIQDIEDWWKGGNPEMFKNKLFLYNTYMLYKSGDPQIRKIINSNDYHEIRAALGDISNGIEPKAKDEMFLDTKYSELMNHVTSTPEYKFAHALYESLIGERESTDVANRYRLPSIYKMVEPVTMALSMTSKPQAIPLIGSMRAALDVNPVDAAWFADLFTNKDGKVSKDDVMRLINDINDNFYKYGQSTKIAKQLASQHARSMVDMWKARLIQTETPKISKYDREELLRLLDTPVRKNILDYEKDINFIEKVMTDSNYRSAFDAAKKQQQLARNRFARNNKDNINFYMAVRRLTSINLKMFDTPEKLAGFSSLISTRIENVNVKDFIRDADKINADYLEWKKQYNDQYKTGSDTSAKDSTPLEDAMMEMRKDLAAQAIKNLVNVGQSVTDKKYIGEFAEINPRELDNKDFEKYEDILHELLNNPTEVDNKLIKLVDKQKANAWFDKASETLSKKYIDILNEKSMPSDIIDIITDNITGSVPLIQFPKLKREGLKVKITGWHDKLGNISAHSLSTIFDALEGFPKAQIGMLNSEIRQPLDAAYKQYLNGVASATHGLSPVGKFTNASMHLVGMHGLLNQLPDFSVSASTLKFLHEKGIDIDNIATKQVLTHNETDPELKEAYDLINKDSKDMIKDSILISFGLKPDGNWSDKEIEAILNDTAVMSRRSKKEIQDELAEILKQTGASDLHSIIDDIIEGRHELSPEEKDYLDTVYKRLSEVRNGDHSNGVTLKDAAEKYSGTQFLEIPNYFPMIRYKTYLTAKTYFDPNGEESNDAKIFHGIYSDFNMNTAFLTQRKPAVMSLNTNAYDAVRKRIDDQVFYLNHIDQQTYLYDVFRTPFFNGDNATFNTNLSNHIIGFLNMYFNRGIDSERALMYKSPTGREVSKWVNRYRAFVLGNPLSSFKITSAAVFSMAKLEGSGVTRLQNMKDGVGMMTNSYIQGTPEEKFLRENAPEVYMRGMATYDISTYESEMRNTEGGILADFLPGKVKGVLGGLSKGVYQTESGAIKNIGKEFFRNESTVGVDASLAGIVWNHRIAARTAFFALYKNYCDSHNVPVDFENPNEDALTFANEGVRATQNTDNPIHRTGLQSGLIPGDTRWWGQFNSLNLLAFKSFAINERSTLMQANERLANAVHDKDWDEAAHQAKYFAYSFASKFLFNLIKLQSVKITAAAAAYMLTDADSRKESYDRSIDAKSSLGIMAFKTILDYFTFNELMKWGVSFAAEKGYEKLTDDTSHELDKSQKKQLEYTRDPVDGAIVSGQIGDIIDNLAKGTQTVATDYKKYGLNETTDADAARMSLFIYSLGVNNIPGASSISDIIREMDSQRKANDKAAKEHYESPLKGKSAGGNILKGSKP